MSWLERSVAGLTTLPQEVNETLERIREQSFRNRDIATDISDEESQLLQQIQEAIKDGGDLDESLIKTRADNLVLKRKDLSARMDLQIKAASYIYDRCGKWIIFYKILLLFI